MGPFLLGKAMDPCIQCGSGWPPLKSHLELYVAIAGWESLRKPHVRFSQGEYAPGRWRKRSDGSCTFVRRELRSSAKHWQYAGAAGPLT